MTQIDLKVIFSVLLILGVIGGVALGMNSSADEFDDDTDLGTPVVITTTEVVTLEGDTVITTTEAVTSYLPPETVVETITTDGRPATTTIVRLPTTTPKTPSTTAPKPIDPSKPRDGKIAIKGEFGLYDSQGNEIKAYDLSFQAEGKTISYYQAKSTMIEIYGGSGLKASTFVVYFRSSLFNPATGKITRLADDKLFIASFKMRSKLLSASFKTESWGTVDLSDHWYGKAKVQFSHKIPISTLLGQTDVIIPLGETRTVTFIHETIVECKDLQGEVVGAIEKHRLQADIKQHTAYYEGLPYFPCSFVGGGSSSGMIFIKFLAMVAIIAVVLRYYFQ